MDPFFHACVSLVGCFVTTLGKRLAILRRLGCPVSIPDAPPHPRMLRILPPPVPEGGVMEGNAASYAVDGKYVNGYDTVVLEVKEIEKSSNGSVKDTNQNDSFLDPKELYDISIADLLDLVKGDAGKYIPKHSEVNSQSKLHCCICFENLLFAHVLGWCAFFLDKRVELCYNSR